MAQLKPFYTQVQAHYDISNDFFALFLDPSRTYSCAYFERDDMTLAEAQTAKLDLALGKCDLRPGMRLLDIGCGWGSAVRRAAEVHNVHAIGLTLSRNQYDYATSIVALDPPRAGECEFRLQGWEEFTEPVDRIVTIGAFEHFRFARYGDFFDRCRALLPQRGRMLLHTIVWPDPEVIGERRFGRNREELEFARFIRNEIFPAGQLCLPKVVIDHAEQHGFRVLATQSFQSHYARTLDCWLANLEAARDRAILLSSRQVFERFVRYLSGSSKYFHSRQLDVMQFTLAPC